MKQNFKISIIMVFLKTSKNRFFLLNKKCFQTLEWDSKQTHSSGVCWFSVVRTTNLVCPACSIETKREFHRTDLRQEWGSSVFYVPCQWTYKSEEYRAGKNVIRKKNNFWCNDKLWLKKQHYFSSMEVQSISCHESLSRNNEFFIPFVKFWKYQVISGNYLH